MTFYQPWLGQAAGILLSLPRSHQCCQTLLRGHQGELALPLPEQEVPDQNEPPGSHQPPRATVRVCAPDPDLPSCQSPPPCVSLNQGNPFGWEPLTSQPPMRGCPLALGQVPLDPGHGRPLARPVLRWRCLETRAPWLPDPSPLVLSLVLGKPPVGAVPFGTP